MGHGVPATGAALAAGAAWPCAGHPHHGTRRGGFKDHTHLILLHVCSVLGIPRCVPGTLCVLKNNKVGANGHGELAEELGCLPQGFPGTEALRCVIHRNRDPGASNLPVSERLSSEMT